MNAPGTRRPRAVEWVCPRCNGAGRVLLFGPTVCGSCLADDAVHVDVVLLEVRTA